MATETLTAGINQSCSMWNWLRCRNAVDPLVQSDARALIERFGDAAYFEARLRQHDDDVRVIDSNRPPGHWERVKRAIAQTRDKKRGYPNGP